MNDTKAVVRKRRESLRQKGIDLLRQAGAIVSAQANDMQIVIIADSIEVRFENNKWLFRIDGEDFTDKIVGIRITGVPFDFPVVSPSFKPKTMVNINSDERPRKQLYDRVGK